MQKRISIGEKEQLKFCRIGLLRASSLSNSKLSNLVSSIPFLKGKPMYLEGHRFSEICMKSPWMIEVELYSRTSKLKNFEWDARFWKMKINIHCLHIIYTQKVQGMPAKQLRPLACVSCLYTSVYNYFYSAEIPVCWWISMPDFFCKKKNIIINITK